MPTVTVSGWMTEEERLALRRWAFGKDVCEIGAYEGLSTVNLAATARSVVAVDTFDAKGTVHHPKDTLGAFQNAIRETGVADRVTTRVGLSADILPTLLPQSFDLIHIDGSHDYESVSADVQLSRPLLREKGWLVFHDYDQNHPGVFRAVQEVQEAGARPVAQAGRLAALTFGPPVVTTAPRVRVVMPHRDAECQLGAGVGLLYPSRKGLPTDPDNHGTSILTQCFNTLLARALTDRREGITHFAMLHNDIIPCPGWLDILWEEMQRLDVDLISAVVPLKNQKGLTSTGLDTPDDPWAVRRLTLAEVFRLPETFTFADVAYREPEMPLLINTGCFLMRLAEPWVEGMCFRQQDRIAYNVVKEEYAAQSISEDWDFARQLHSRGGRVAATRKVTVQHQRPEFHNRSAWGEWGTDEAFQEYLREKTAAA